MGDDGESFVMQRDLDTRLEAARQAACSQSERALALVLDRLLVDTGCERGSLVAFDAGGREVARVERGPVSDSGLILPLRLADRLLARAVLEGATAEAASEALPRAAVGVGNVLHLFGSQTRSFFVAELAHEIRNPLAGILAFSDLLPEEQSELPAKYIHLMTHIQNDAQRLKRLVESVLQSVGARDGADRTLVPVDLAPLAASMAKLFAPWAARRGVTFEAVAEGSVLGDREALALAMANLVANALTATPSGGQVSVKARPGPDREARWGAPGRAVWIEVNDTGPGLHASAVESARGSGLHVARDLILAAGGSIWAEDVQGGARLVMRLPSPG